MTRQQLPFEMSEAVVQTCGRAFWLRDPFRSFLLAAGVPKAVYERYAEEPKFKIARHVLAELDDLGEEGWEIQRRLVTEFCKLRNLPDPNVPDKDAALQSLRALKELAVSQGMFVEQERSKADQRFREAKLREDAAAARRSRLDQLRRTFNDMIASGVDPQSRGYGLENLLVDLFALHEIVYRPPYRIGTEQIDGHFEFKSFDYLVEARWRKDQPSEADLSVLKTKVEKKITSTRGLFVSVVGFRSLVVDEFAKGIARNMVLMSGEDLSLILEGHVSLTDALDLKIQKAAQEGELYFALRNRFSGA